MSTTEINISDIHPFLIDHSARFSTLTKTNNKITIPQDKHIVDFEIYSFEDFKILMHKLYYWNVNIYPAEIYRFIHSHRGCIKRYIHSHRGYIHKILSTVYNNDYDEYDPYNRSPRKKCPPEIYHFVHHHSHQHVDDDDHHDYDYNRLHHNEELFFILDDIYKHAAHERYERLEKEREQKEEYEQREKEHKRQEKERERQEKERERREKEEQRRAANNAIYKGAYKGPNPYHVLGIVYQEHNIITSTEIDKRYKRQFLRLHPDKHHHLLDSDPVLYKKYTDISKMINTAKEILFQPEKATIYIFLQNPHNWTKFNLMETQLFNSI